jgi:RHS repeat-associated protein
MNMTYTWTKGLLTGISALVNSIGYSPNGMVSSISYTNGITETRTPDPTGMSRPASISTVGASPNWSSGTYQYDGAGNIKGIGTDYAIYDSLSRVVEGSALAAGVGKYQNYAFDIYGNMTSMSTSGGSASPLTTSTKNRLTSATYDNDGNMTFYGANNYDFDALGMMTRMNDGSRELWYFYDADDERVWENRNKTSTSTWEIRDLGGHVLTEFNATPTTTSWGKAHGYRDGVLAAAVTTPNLLSYRFFTLDHLGTPRLITTGTAGELHAYYPFGMEATCVATDSEAMKFTGHERDLIPGSPCLANVLDYMHARFYSAGTGRFLSVDPALDLKKTLPNPQAWNRYSYVMNNPLRYTDPTGRESDPGELDCLDPQAMSRFIGSALHLSALREAFSGIGSAPWNEKLMAGAIGVIAAADVGSNFLAPEKATVGVLLGENMATVTGGAEKLGLSTFRETGSTFADTIAKNMKWLGDQVKSGAKIFDIGLDASRGGRTGVFFKAEVAFMEKAGYTRQFAKLTEIDGKTYRVYEWVPRQ